MENGLRGFYGSFLGGGFIRVIWGGVRFFLFSIFLFIGFFKLIENFEFGLLVFFTDVERKV